MTSNERLLFQSNPTPGMIITTQGVPVDINAALLKQSRIPTVEEFIGDFANIARKLVPSHQPDGRVSLTLSDRLRTMLSGGEDTFITYLAFADDVRPSRMTLKHFDSDGQALIIAWIEDATYSHHNAYTERIRAAQHASVDALLNIRDLATSETMIPHAVSILCKAIGANRASVCRCKDRFGDMVEMLYDWSDLPGDDRHVTRLLWQNFSLAERFPTSRSHILQNKPLNACITDLAGKDGESFKMLGVKAVIVVPQYVMGELWGFVTFEDCESERVFTETEVSGMQIGVSILVSCIKRLESIGSVEQAEEEKRQTLTAKERELQDALDLSQMLVDLSPLSICITRNDFTRLYCNKTTLDLLEIDNIEDFTYNFFEFQNEIAVDGKTPFGEAYNALISATLKRGHIRREWTARSKISRREIPVVSDCYPIKWHGQDCVVHYTQDMAEIYRRESELKKLSQNAEMMFNATPMMASLWDSDFRVIDCNDTIVTKLGLADKEEFIKNYDKLYTKYQKGTGRLNKSVWRENMEIAMQDGFHRFEWGYLLPNGQTMPTEVTMRRVSYGVDQRLAVYATDLRRIIAKEEQALRARRQTDIMFDSMTISCTLWNSDLEIIDCNQRAVELFEAKDKNQLIEAFESTYPEFQPDGKPSSEKAKYVVRRGLEEGKYECFWEHCSFTGKIMSTTLSLTRVERDGELFVLAYTHDLSDLRRAENEVSMLSSIVEHSPLFTVYLDKSGNVLYANSAVFGTSGYTATELVENGLSLIMPRDRIDELVNRHILHFREDSTIVFESNITCKDGESRILFGHLFDLQQQSGDTYYAFLCNDVTEERRVINALRDAKETAENATRAKSAFLARMSHEIRTPMNAIIGMTELILREDVSFIVREYSLNVKQAGNNLLAIINDILDFSKIESGKMELMAARYKLASVINDAISITRVRLEEKPIVLVTDIDSAIPAELIGDEVRVRQILLNLLSNAVKYTKDGYVKLSLRTVYGEDPSVITLIIEVSDSGIGISAEDQLRLFNDFTRVENTHTIEGTGLGLSVCRMLCKAMGGDVSVVSEIGRGSVFTAEIAQKTCDAPNIAEVKDEHRVLILENNRMIAASLSYSLDSLGVEHTVTHDADAFKQSIAEKDYDFVFVSLSLCAALTARWLEEHVPSGARLVFMSEQGEQSPQISGTVTVLRPLHAITIANLLDGRQNDKFFSNEQEINFRAPDVSVLIVDDILSNLKVIEGLLDPYGMQLDFCLDGKEAIFMVKNKDYDFVLMDHMMPGMDGVETTKFIRGLPGDQYKNLPIIALTANAVSGMKEMFMNNGFDDYISKPIEISKLYEAMDHWIPMEKRVKSANRDPVIIEEGERIQIEGIDTEYGLRMSGGKQQVYLEVLTLFCRDAEERLPALEKCPDEDGLSLFTTNVHALKGASGSLGAVSVSRLALSLEEAGRMKDIPAIRSNLDAFREDLILLVTNIKQAIDATSAARAASPGVPLEMNKLFSLREALEQGKIRAADQLIDEIALCDTPNEIASRIEKIAEHVLTSDFADAIGELNIIIETMKGGD